MTSSSTPQDSNGRPLPQPRPPRGRGPSDSQGKAFAASPRKKSPFGPWSGIIASLLVAVLGGWLLLPGVGPDILGRGGTHPSEEPSASAVSTPSEGEEASEEKGSLEALARRQLAELEVRPKAYVPGYDRSAFGPAWEDVDGNGCDTRNDVLARDLEDIRYRKGSRCVIQSGVLHDPYVGVTMPFQRGDATSPLVQIDHVVALGDAWRAGAWQWTPAERVRFANDPENLLAVEGQANQDKEASRADQWMPPNEEYHCAYVRRQIAVKHAWGLSVIERERQAMLKVLDSCP